MKHQCQEAVSEYLQTPSKTQLLITDRVRFVTDNRKLIPAYQMSKHPGVWVSAVTLHIKSRNRFWQLLHQSLWDYSIRRKEDRSPKYPADWTLKLPYFAEQPLRLAIASGITPPGFLRTPCPVVA